MSDKQIQQQLQINMMKSTYALNSQELQQNQAFENDQEKNSMQYPCLEKSQQYERQKSVGPGSQKSGGNKSPLHQETSSPHKKGSSNRSQHGVEDQDEEQECLQFENEKGESGSQNQSHSQQLEQQNQVAKMEKNWQRVISSQEVQNQQKQESLKDKQDSDRQSKDSGRQNNSGLNQQQSNSNEGRRGPGMQNAQQQLQIPLSSDQQQSEPQEKQQNRGAPYKSKYEEKTSSGRQNQKKLMESEYEQNRVSEAQQLVYKQNNKQQDQGSKQEVSIKGKPLLQLHEEDEMPEVSLKPSAINEQPTILKFTKYSLEYFLKIETQVFTIEVTPSTEQSDIEVYFIKRRFSDFVFLFDSIITNHPGYILYPFPEKNLQSFIKLKLNLNRQQGQKIELIEQRMSQLERFSNFLFSHPELRNSEEVNIFIRPDEQFDHERKRIQSYVQEIKQLESSSNIKNLMDKGMGLISSYLSRTKPEQKPSIIGEKDLQFGIYLQKAQQFIEKVKSLMDLFTQLEQVQSSNATFTDIDTDVDALLKLCAKHTSGREYSRYFGQWISNEMLEFVSFRFREMKQVEQQLLQRIHIVELSRQLGSKNDQRQKQDKLRRRIQRFERNFLFSWPQTLQSAEKQLLSYSKDFQKQWRNYQMHMSKIWSPKGGH